MTTTPEHTPDGAAVNQPTSTPVPPEAYVPPTGTRFRPDGEAYQPGGAEYREPAEETARAYVAPEATFDEDGRRTDQPDQDDPAAVAAWQRQQQDAARNGARGDDEDE